MSCRTGFLEALKHQQQQTQGCRLPGGTCHTGRASLTPHNISSSKYSDVGSLIEHVPYNCPSSAHNAEGSGGGDPQVVHGLTADELPDGGAHDSPPICHARVRRFASPLQLQLPLLPTSAADLA